jgi:hypothetical protein
VAVAKKIPWDALVDRLAEGLVTPFLGAGISRPPLPSADELAEKLVAEHDRTAEDPYPFQQRDLMHVAQYWATMVDNQEPKRAVRRIFQEIEPPDFKAPDQAHAILATLNCSVYLTTNYDDYMEEALRRSGRSPVTEVCRWTTGLSTRPSHLTDQEPEQGKPVVYHLHGHIDDPESMVLTEDDYLDFMVNVRRFSASDPNLLVLPPKIDELLTQTSLLFLGYGLRDWNLRVLLRALVENRETSSKKLGVSVQLEPDSESLVDPGLEVAIGYLEQYFDGTKLRVFWGTADQFLAELRKKAGTPVAA